MTKLGDMAVGSIVKIKVDGTARDFIIVHQGKPSSMYDSSCNGTWLLMKGCYEQRAWDSSDNDYKNSDIHAYLNGTFFGLLDSNIKETVKQVKIPYVNGTTFSNVASGSNGLSVKIFLLGCCEVGFEASSTIPADGAKLRYFSSGTDTSANNKRIAYYIKGTAAFWWLRSVYKTLNNNVCYIDESGNNYNGKYTYSNGVRPAFILPTTMIVDTSGNVLPNTAPTAPASISVPTTVKGGESLTITWSASSDSNGNLSGYKLERSVNGGSYSQIYSGSSRSYTDTITKGWSTVQYRIKAYDSAGAESGYTTSPSRTVINNTAPTISGNKTSGSNMGEISAPFNFTYTVRDAENHTVTVKEYLDNALQRSYTATLGATNTFQATSSVASFQNISYASHTIKVVATDSEGASSADYVVYFTKVNTAPTITSDKTGDLGVLTDGFVCKYSVDDADTDDVVTVSLYMDDTQIDSFEAAKRQQYTYTLEGNDWLKITNGSHTFKISATDSKETVESTATFTRNCTSLTTTLSTPLPANDNIVACTLKVAGSIPSDAVCKYEVTNNASDPEPVWEDCTAKTKAGLSYIFTNKTAENGFAFNFRVSIERGASGAGGYITGVSGGFE